MSLRVPYPLLAKFFSGQCSKEEIEELENWRQESPENERVFAELFSEWDIAGRQFSCEMVFPDKEKVWNKIQLSVKKPVISYSRAVLIKVASLAASIALLIGLSVSFFWHNQNNNHAKLNTVFISPAGQKSRVILPDGSKVWLNSQSSISCSGDFGQTDRSVTLRGEAYFDVVKNKDLKFVVKTGAVSVVVHGTAFNVKSYSKDKILAVTLVHGKVDVVAATDNRCLAVMSPGQRVVVDKKDLTFNVEQCDASADAVWRLEQLKFVRADVNEVAEKLSKWYGVTVKVTDPARFPRFWFTVKNEKLVDILKSMDRLHPMKYDVKQDSVFISSR